jgi:hypothetical protein
VTKTQAVIRLLPSKPKLMLMKRRHQRNLDVSDSIWLVSSQVRVINFVHSLPRNYDLTLTFFSSLRRRALAGEHDLLHSRANHYLRVMSYSHHPLFAFAPTTTSTLWSPQIRLLLGLFSTSSSPLPRPLSPLLTLWGRLRLLLSAAELDRSCFDGDAMEA